MRKAKDLKPLPKHTTDESAELFTDTADLTQYDLSGFETTTFEFKPKSARLEVRVAVDQLAALKDVARNQGVPHTRLVRQFIEQGIKSLQTPRP